MDYKFMDNGDKYALEGRYYNANGFSLAIVASITREVDWSAYIGSYSSQMSEEATLMFVLSQGCKLHKEDAKYYFPDVELPYRN
jgi:hypothetical protein